MAATDYAFSVNSLIIIAVAMAAPIVLDTYFAYKRTKHSTGEYSGSPVGMPGLYRATMTLGLILLVAIIVFYIMTLLTTNIANISNSNNTNNAVASAITQINQTLIQMLANLSTILGVVVSILIAFYFGNRRG